MSVAMCISAPFSAKAPVTSARFPITIGLACGVACADGVGAGLEHAASNKQTNADPTVGQCALRRVMRSRVNRRSCLSYARGRGTADARQNRYPGVSDWFRVRAYRWSDDLW